MTKKLSYEYRLKIKFFLEQRLSYTKIASALGVNVSTITREIKKGTLLVKFDRSPIKNNINVTSANDHPCELLKINLTCVMAVVYF